MVECEAVCTRTAARGAHQHLRAFCPVRAMINCDWSTIDTTAETIGIPRWDVLSRRRKPGWRL